MPGYASPRSVEELRPGCAARCVGICWQSGRTCGCRLFALRWWLPPRPSPAAAAARRFSPDAVFVTGTNVGSGGSCDGLGHVPSGRMRWPALGGRMKLWHASPLPPHCFMHVVQWRACPTHPPPARGCMYIVLGAWPPGARRRVCCAAGLLPSARLRA